MRGASVHVARFARWNRDQVKQIVRSAGVSASRRPLSPLAQTLFSVHPQRETAVEMLEEVHKGLRPIDALKVAIDRRLLSHFLVTRELQGLHMDIIRCLRNDVLLRVLVLSVRSGDRELQFQ